MKRIRLSMRPMQALFLTLLFALMAACAPSSNAPPEDPPSGPDPKPEDKDVVSDRYAAANQCFALKAGDGYISQQDGAYGLSTSADDATAFYWKPSSLGQYLLLSSYSRAPGEQGNKELLGISDPMGELLDQFGNFIGEAGWHVAGVGDIAEFVTNPVVLPLQGQIEGASGGAFDSEDAPRPRNVGDAVTLVGDTLGEQNAQPGLALVTSANDLAVWQMNSANEDAQNPLYSLSSAITGQYLANIDGQLSLADELGDGGKFELIRADHCDQYPEASVNATVAEEGNAIYMKDVAYFAEEIENGELSGDEIYGYVDAHAHLSAYEFIGGRINYGDPFHKFGVDHALDDCQENHGPQGMTGFVEHVTTDIGQHATQGWPDFEYWPRRNSLQHHQSYYKWIERTWLAGQKIMVNHLVHNEVLCQLNPQKQNDCDPMPAILLQAEKMQDMQDYIDAQYGGPGKGWFQIVTSSADARRVIDQGQMAVILGVEMSKVMNCGEFQGVAQCTEAEIVQRLDRLQDAKVSSMFPVHKFDNAFGGHLPDLGNPAGISGVLYAGNLAETGHPVEYETCPEEPYRGDETDQGGHDYLAFPTEPEFSQDSLEKLGLIDQLLFQLDYLGKLFPASPEEFAEYDPRRGTGQHCNTRGLTELGEFLVGELMRRNMMIELDHISNKAAAKILEITKGAIADGVDYPTINSHGGWSHSKTRHRIVAQGGFTTPFGSGRSGLFNNLINYGKTYPDAYKVGPFGGVGMSSDVNGIASLAGNGGGAGDLPEFFEALDGRVVFGRQQTGDKVFDLHEPDRDGIDHYGLYADQVSDMIAWAKREGKSEAELKQALGNLYSSAEAYIRMWERVEAYSAP